MYESMKKKSDKMNKKINKKADNLLKFLWKIGTKIWDSLWRCLVFYWIFENFFDVRKVDSLPKSYEILKECQNMFGSPENSESSKRE